MLALRFQNQELALASVPRPRADGEALVRVSLSGICNTDLEIVRGYAGFEGTIGHEFVGTVESLPEAMDQFGLDQNVIRVGQRVVGEINAGCGRCPLCLSGDARHCPRRTVLGIVGRDGAHAEFLRLPIVNLLPVPDEVSDREAVFTEPLAAACGILERVEVNAETRLAVIGDGKLGLLCAQVLRLACAHVLLVGKHAEKLRIAEARGIETATVDEARRRGRELDLVVEASGSESGFELALGLLRPRGVLLLKSTFHGETRMMTARIVVDEMSIIGSRCGRFAPALELLQKRAVDVESLLSEEYALADSLRAMQRAAERGVLKVLLKP
ncbi:MAG TPA: alcohol dehydrogenase catalytic domain-containing protein [Pyrinomonadaceae bacterium]|jgi:threonine dehydrogenase-like Zn-dependent dehydrogenase